MSADAAARGPAMMTVAAQVSVVTPSYNQAQYLVGTLQSILNQGDVPLECLVIDGGSTDGSIQILRRRADRLTYWVSEPDRGQAHAINKGFGRATGALLTWINSDDLLLPDALASAVCAHNANPDAILLGDVVHFSDDEALTFAVRQHNVRLENLIAHWRHGWVWNQPGTFIPRSVWQTIGPLDESLRYTFDREWMCRALAAGVPVVYLGKLVAAFRIHAGSKTMGETMRWGQEQMLVTRRYAHLVPELSPAEIEAQHHMLEGIFRLSLLYVTSWDAAAARQHLATARRIQPTLALSRDFWQLWARSLAPLGVVRVVRRVWLRSRREAALRQLLPTA